MLDFLLPKTSSVESKSNWLRAAVLGANDGIVSMAGLVLGVAGATTSVAIILTAGVAGIIAASISMAVGEYVSVSSARDLQKALIKKERQELKDDPDGELEELALMYKERGLTHKTALAVARELTEKNPIKAHLDIEHKIDPEDLVNPWHAAVASAISFLIGGVIPLLGIILPPPDLRIPVTFVSVLIALFVTGTVSAKMGGANIPRAVTRVMVGGAVAMVVTNLIGRAFGVRGL